MKEIFQVARKELPLSVVMIDIDLFTAFNDHFGHEAGDRVLKGLARLFQKHVKGGDFACRLGGEEFSLILPAEGFGFPKGRRHPLRRSRNCNWFRERALAVLTISRGAQHLRKTEQPANFSWPRRTAPGSWRKKTDASGWRCMPHARV